MANWIFHFLPLHLCLSSGRDVRDPNKLRIQFQLVTNLKSGACGEENWNAKLWKILNWITFAYGWSGSAVQFRVKAFNSVLLSFHVSGLPLRALLARNIRAKIIQNRWRYTPECEASTPPSTQTSLMWVITLANDLLTFQVSASVFHRLRPIASTSTLSIQQLVALPANRNKVTGEGKISFQYIIELWFIALVSKHLHLYKSGPPVSVWLCGCEKRCVGKIIRDRRGFREAHRHSLKGSECRRRPRDIFTSSFEAFVLSKLLSYWEVITRPTFRPRLGTHTFPSMFS